jgi:hypothetical protein
MKKKLNLTFIGVLVSVAILLFACAPEEDLYKKTPTPTGFRVYSNEGLKVQLRWDETIAMRFYRIGYKSSDFGGWNFETLYGKWDRYTFQFSEGDAGKFYAFRLYAILDDYDLSDYVETTAVIRK